MVEYFVPFIAIAGVLCVVAFSMGQWSKEHPSEEEMFHRLVAARRTRRMEKEVNAALDDELNRRAAQS